MADLICAALPDRALLPGWRRGARLLNALVSNEVSAVVPGTAVYAALLSPQGKFLHDFLVTADGSGDLLIDVAAERLPDLQRRLMLYRLRAKVEIAVLDGWRGYAVFGAEPPASGADLLFADPRLPALGWRLWLPAGTEPPFTPADPAIYEAHRLALGVPDGVRDIEVDKGLLLENHFEALHGVDFRKGCYIGQELTARTKYRGLVKKQLYRVTAQDPDKAVALPAIGTPITANGQEVGQLRSSTGHTGLALLRLDTAQQGVALDAAGIALTAQRPDYAGPIPEAKT